ncbi:TetR/AcrR family transcriptional regulator [Pseudobdellovibrio exovorus]|uniref:HTH tetR-type domain-containing protein n=1 Tax=Pseudobdellovibrio exovorus JSS TaxID=1184267 RepID=M4VTZ6_9BACT|nr:TetR/AcrR family transcriptional regulator [Pseudobdellovibrio exovorus]AGH96689.1 hypothetical protein A11Q_2473 [Pseudobdellovibrio exovorus JSS]
MNNLQNYSFIYNDPMPRVKAEGRADQILDAALLHFARHGYAKTSIAEIAKSSQIAAGTIYLYYSSKEEILRACAVRFHQAHQTAVFELLQKNQLSPDQKLKEYILNRFELWQKETISSKVSSQLGSKVDSQGGSDLAQAMITIAPEINQQEQDLWNDTLRKILEEGQKKKLYHFDSLTKELRIFLHCLVGFFPLPGINHPFAPTEKDLREMLQWFCEKWRTK